MGDTLPSPNFSCLFDVASTQHGYFTSGQAGTCGYDWSLLKHHARRGTFIRIRRGLYRLRDYPSGPNEEVMAAWLAAGAEDVTVSHTSALALFELSDIIPDSIHLTVPRSRRHLPHLPGVTFHTSTRPPRTGHIMHRDGLPVTTPARAIIDSAEFGAGPEQIEMAIGQALARGLTTAPLLLEEAAGHGSRVQRLVSNAIEDAGR